MPVSRKALYKKFGPQLFVAITELLVDEINTLRANAGLSERTADQARDAIVNKLASLPDIDWNTSAD